MKKTVAIICLVFQQVGFAQHNIAVSIPPVVPALLQEVNINTGFSERDFALSPDGNEIFYTLQSPGRNFQTIIYLQKDKNGTWSQPALAAFAGRYSDLEPAFSPDGKKLFFTSNRPLQGDKMKDFDIWFAEKENGQWGEPKNIGLPVNTPADEFYPSVSKKGNLYFTAAYKDAVGKEDIYLSVWDRGKYLQPVPLDTAINSQAYEFNAFVSPDERYIIFSSFGRKDEKGRGDLYISLKDDQGKWKPAKNIEQVNSDRLDYCPFVSFDEKILYFTSERHNLKDHFNDKPVSYTSLIQSYSSVLNGGGNIYWVDFELLLKSMN